MAPDLDALLCARYPILLKQRSLSPEKSPLAWGFTCEDGWFLIFDQLLAWLQAAADRGRIPQPVVSQVKEKFGTLRCRLDEGICPRSIRLIDWASLRAFGTCERCGAPGQLQAATGYGRYVRCKRHAIPNGTIEHRGDHVA